MPAPPDRRQQVDAVFAEAVDLPPGDRAAFLARACPDAGMRAEVEAMLAADAQADAFFADAALHLADVAEELTARPPERAGPWRLGRLLGRGASQTIKAKGSNKAKVSKHTSKEWQLYQAECGLVHDPCGGVARQY